MNISDNASYAASKYISLEVKAPARLLPFLMEQMSGASRNKVKDILTGRGVMVDRKTVTRHDYELVPGNVVLVCRHKRSTELTNRFVKIVYEDKELVVIEKGEGILSMANAAGQFCVKMVLDEYFRKRQFKCHAHVVHRLDRETSGLMIYAKRIECAQALQSDWHNIVYDRRYVAVVCGEMPQEGGTVESYLKDNKACITYSSPTDNGGKLAVTHFRRLRVGGGLTLVELKLETGRKNQIRVHMADLGFPVLGDLKYGGRGTSLGRLCLHAYRLHFYHPMTGAPMQFETPIPTPFLQLFNEQQTN
ncbi:MAG: RluA family pseudouridine synthase [Bacteroidaceae bacterium]|nr:RluA family pseudouridine synthase [Bacteroidaceae bacterium]